MMTLSMMTLSIMILGIRNLIAAISTNNIQHYIMLSVAFFAMLVAVLVSVVMQNVVAPI
jgi:hypothetical protein